MPKIKKILSTTLTSGGGTVNLPVTDPYKIYKFTGSATLSSSYNIQASGTPITGMMYELEYEASLALDGNTLTIFGVSIGEELALKNFRVVAYYDGSAWVTKVLIDTTPLPFVTEDMITADAIVTAKIDDDAVTTAKILDANVTTAKIADANITAVKLATDSVTTAKIADNNVTTGKLASQLQVQDIVVPLSFESNEQAMNEIQIDYDFTLTSINFSVTKAIAATDDGTVSFYINGVATTAATKTFAASTAINTADSITFSGNNTGTAGQKIRLTTSKVTAGGKVLATLKITRR
jgi:hypothetical protein